ncbi:MAG: SRPBCC family protein [Anaerolineales bacterium]
MKQGVFEESIYIQTSPERVLALVSDYNQHHLIHPLIVKVEPAEAPPGVLKRYFITDQLQWGPLRFKIVYRADILEIAPDRVHTQAYQSPATTVDNLTRITPEGSGTRLTETITLRAPDLLFGYAFEQARTAHHAMLERIKNCLEK